MERAGDPGWDRRPHEHRSAFHDEDYAADRGCILERISIHRDDVGLVAWRNRSDLIAQSQRCRGERGRRYEGSHGVLLAVVDADDELVAVVSVGSRSCVRTVDDLEAGDLERPLERLEDDRLTLLHEGKAFVVVVADAHVLRLVLDVILKNDADVGVVVGAVGRHDLEDIVGDVSSVFDGCATGHAGRLGSRGSVGMHQGPQSKGLGLAACSLQLSVGHGLVAAFANALGGEDLDEVGTLGLALADELAQLVRVAAGLRERLQGGQESGAGNDAACDRIAEWLIHRRSWTLDGGEACFEGQVRIFDAVQNRWDWI